MSALWSWNGARLIALVLNALYGLEEYYSAHYKDLDGDGLFGLRVIEGQLKGIQEAVAGRDVHSEVIDELRNLSALAGATADKAVAFVTRRNSEYFNKLQDVFMRPYKVKFIHQRTDERLRWKEKQFRPVLFAERESDGCIAELLAKNDDSTRGNFHRCQISDSCLEQMVGQRGLTGYHLTHQILYVAIALQTSCVSIISHFISSTSNQTIANFLTEQCTNLIDEVRVVLKNPRITARMDHAQRDLLMEQIFTCGEFGFVEVASLHLLASILSWQDPVLGCFKRDETSAAAKDSAAYSVTGRGVFRSPISRKLLIDTVHNDLCSTHYATVASGALVVYLRFLLDRGPWPEFYLADQPVIVHSIAAEDKFRQYRYSRWVRDSFITSVEHARPPHIGWSPDLLAYLLLLCIMLGGSVVAHFCYRPRVKRFYHFSYKKL